MVGVFQWEVMESFLKANYGRCILMGSNGEFYKGKLW